MSSMGMGPSQYVDPLMKEVELSDEERALREEFVRWYMRDRNSFEACLKLGFKVEFAEDWGCKFLSEGFVQRLIAHAEASGEGRESPEERKNKYRSLMEREATYYGAGSSHSARVSAIAQLMKIEGMDAPTKLESEVIHKGGVMVVPAIGDVASWGDAAAQSQSKLKESVRE